MKNTLNGKALQKKTSGSGGHNDFFDFNKSNSMIYKMDNTSLPNIVFPKNGK